MKLFASQKDLCFFTDHKGNLREESSNVNWIESSPIYITYELLQNRESHLDPDLTLQPDVHRPFTHPVCKGQAPLKGSNFTEDLSQPLQFTLTYGKSLGCACVSLSHLSLLSARDKCRPENAIIHQFISQRQPNSVSLLFLTTQVKKVSVILSVS